MLPDRRARRGVELYIPGEISVEGRWRQQGSHVCTNRLGHIRDCHRGRIIWELGLEQWHISVNTPKPIDHVTFVKARRDRCGKRLLCLILDALAVSPPVINKGESRIENGRSVAWMGSLLYANRCRPPSVPNSAGWWQVAQLTLPSTVILGSTKSSRPRVSRSLVTGVPAVRMSLGSG